MMRHVMQRWLGLKIGHSTSPSRFLSRHVTLLLVLAAAACQATPRTRPTIPTPKAHAVPSTTPSPSPSRAFRPRDVHKAEGAGKWYPADRHKLQAAVQAYVSQAEVDPIPGPLMAVIVPHAGYIYSGAVAGHAFRALQEAGCADHTLAVIGDTHSGLGSATIAVWASGAFETPLGSIPVDEKVAQAIVDADPRIEFDRTAFQLEHPVENQLPFIQIVCPGAQIVPIVIRSGSREPPLETAQVLASALAEAFDESPGPEWIVASTDLSHYHPYQEAQQIDEVALQAIVSLDPQAVINSPRRCAELGIADTQSTMCSMGAVLTAMIAAQRMGANAATLLHYANSGDVPFGEREQVVGYGAVALWQAAADSVQEHPGGTETLSSLGLGSTPAEPADPVLLSQEAQSTLLALARRTIAQFLASETVPPFRTDDPALLQPLGAYVTYEKNGALRGCLGRLVGDRPVYLSVQYAALAAALNDHRFTPVTIEELESLTIEITLIHPLRLVESPNEMQIGRDGILMRVGEKQGALFLPQVPVEQGWDLEATLFHLCSKAGLPQDTWQHQDARFYVFGGQWFGEGAEGH